jgi:hypothetical protein
MSAVMVLLQHQKANPVMVPISTAKLALLKDLEPVLCLAIPPVDLTLLTATHAVMVSSIPLVKVAMAPISMAPLANLTVLIMVLYLAIPQPVVMSPVAAITMSAVMVW